MIFSGLSGSPILLLSSSQLQIIDQEVHSSSFWVSYSRYFIPFILKQTMFLIASIPNECQYLVRQVYGHGTA